MYTYKRVKSGSLHPVKVITRSTSVVPLGGPPVVGLNCRPYFARRDAVHKHVQLLAAYCESTWTPVRVCTIAHSPYEYRRRKSEQELEEARLQRALTGSLNTGLMPSSSLYARGGGGHNNFCGHTNTLNERNQKRSNYLHLRTCAWAQLHTYASTHTHTHTHTHNSTTYMQRSSSLPPPSCM